MVALLDMWLWFMCWMPASPPIHLPILTSTDKKHVPARYYLWCLLEGICGGGLWLWMWLWYLYWMFMRVLLYCIQHIYNFCFNGILYTTHQSLSHPEHRKSFLHGIVHPNVGPLPRARSRKVNIPHDYQARRWPKTPMDR